MDVTDYRRLARAVRATVVAEVFHVAGDEAPRAAVVTPFVDDDRVVLALPLAAAPLADALAAAGQAALVLSDGRMALRDWLPLAVTGHFAIEPDLDGRRFRDTFLEQELRKHPPARLLADSLRDRKDNWWYLPRLLCELRPTGPPRPIARRSGPTTGVLAWRAGGHHLATESVEVVDADDDTVSLRALSGGSLRGAGEPAVLFRHDYSQPDLERRAERHERGQLHGSTLRVVSREGDLVLPPPPGLLERVRRHRSLSRACRQELARRRRAAETRS